MGLCFRHPREHHLLLGVPRANADVPAGVPEEVDGGVQLGAVRGGALQLHAVDPVRAGEDQLQPAADHQRLRVRRGGGLHRALPGVRAQARQAPHPGLLPPPQRRRLLPHRRRHRLPRRPHAPRQGPRLRLPRLLHGRLRRAPQRHLCGDQDEERRVHALLALLLPHPQRRRLVLLRPLHQGHLRHAAERGRVLLRDRPDDALLLLPEARHVGAGATDVHRRRGHGARCVGGGGSGGGAPRRHAPGRGHADGEHAAGAGGAAEDGAGDWDAHPAQRVHQGLLTKASLADQLPAHY